MKKSIFLAALVLVSAGCFAQKANVNKARNLSDSETPDFAGARDAINLALENDETNYKISSIIWNDGIEEISCTIPE